MAISKINVYEYNAYLSTQVLPERWYHNDIEQEVGDVVETYPDPAAQCHEATNLCRYSVSHHKSKHDPHKLENREEYKAERNHHAELGETTGMFANGLVGLSAVLSCSYIFWVIMSQWSSVFAQFDNNKKVKDKQNGIGDNKVR